MISSKLEKIKQKINSLSDDIFIPNVLQFLERFERKLFLHFEAKIWEKFIPKKWDIYFVELWSNIKAEINKTRPCMIYSDEYANQWDTIVILPLKTLYWKLNYKFEILIQESKINWLKKKSRLTITQIRSVSKVRLKWKIGKLESSYIWQIEERIKIIFWLNKKATHKE